MRGFVFTIVFSALFFLLLFSVSYYISSRGSAILGEADQGVTDANGRVMDDLSSDLASYLEIGISGAPLNASNKTSITFTDKIPSTLASPGTEFSQWAVFVQDDFPVQANINVTMNMTDFSLHPRLVALPYNLAYGWGALDKQKLTVNGSSLVSNYSVVMRLNRAINVTNESNWTWSAGTTPLFLSLDLEDSKGQAINISNRTSGYIDPNTANSFYMGGSPSGNITLEVGNLAGAGASALRITPAGLSAMMNTTVLLNGTPEITVFAPIWVTVGEQQSNLILHEG